MKRTILTALSAVSLLTIVACGSPAPSSTGGAPSTDQPGSTEQSEIAFEGSGGTVSDGGVQGARSVHDGTAVFAYGDTATYPTGKAMTVSYVEETELSNVGAADCGVGDPVSVFEVTVTNDDSGLWDPAVDLMLAASYEDSSGELVEASDVFDEYGDASLDAGQSLPRLMSGDSGSSLVGFCHPGGLSGSVMVYGTFYGSDFGGSGDALWVSAESLAVE